MPSGTAQGSNPFARSQFISVFAVPSGTAPRCVFTLRSVFAVPSGTAQGSNPFARFDFKMLAVRSMFAVPSGTAPRCVFTLRSVFAVPSGTAQGSNPFARSQFIWGAFPSPYPTPTIVPEGTIVLFFAPPSPACPTIARVSFTFPPVKKSIPYLSTAMYA